MSRGKSQAARASNPAPGGGMLKSVMDTLGFWWPFFVCLAVGFAVTSRLAKWRAEVHRRRADQLEAILANLSDGRISFGDAMRRAVEIDPAIARRVRNRQPRC